MRSGYGPAPMNHAVLAVALAALSPVGARAELQYDVPTTYRLRVDLVDPAPTDEEGTHTERHLVGRQRLRLRPTVRSTHLDVHLELDLMTGQIFGDSTTLGSRDAPSRWGDQENAYDGWTNIEPRMAFVEVRTPVGVIRAGQMGSAWGTGILAQDGEDRTDGGTAGWHRSFGDAWNGDLVDRLLFATQPLSPILEGAVGDLTLVLGADWVWADDQASFIEGDKAWQLVAAAVLPGARRSFGTYLAHREQTDGDLEVTKVTAFDATMTLMEADLFKDVRLRLISEAVYVTGTSQRQQRVVSSEVHDVDVRQLGWMARLDAAFQSPGIAAAIEVGYASGDSDPQDGEARAFTFDPDHHVGLVLFGEVLRDVSARAAERVRDPANVGVAPHGDEHLPSHGAVRNAVYLSPGLTFRANGLSTAIGVVTAWAAEPFADPFATFRAGGVPTNAFGGTASRFYGTEVDLYLGHHFPMPSLSAEAGLEAGVLFPSDALKGKGGTGGLDGPTGKAVARLDLRF